MVTFGGDNATIMSSLRDLKRVLPTSYRNAVPDGTLTQ